MEDRRPVEAGRTASAMDKSGEIMFWADSKPAAFILTELNDGKNSGGEGNQKPKLFTLNHQPFGVNFNT